MTIGKLRITPAIILLCLAISLSAISQDTISKKEIRKQQKNFLIPGRPWTVEVPLWVPGFGGTFAYGEVSLEGEDGHEIQNPIEPPPPFDFGKLFSRLFTTKWYLKYFFMTKVAYEKNRFIGQLDGLTGAVGESTEFNYNRQQVVQANFRTINLRLFGGYKLINTLNASKTFQYELFAYFGVRMHFQKVYSDLNGIVNRFDINPIWFEPIFGIQNQFTWKRWFVVLQGDYGGFFIPDKYSFQLTTYMFYRSGKVTSIKFGWNHLSLNHKGTFLREDYTFNVSLSGPSLGVVFHF